MGRFYHNPSFNEYATLLGQLHVLMSAHKSESAEAEAIRDEMDIPWRQLDPDEIRLVDGLSADLYTIGVDREPPGESPAKAELEKFSEAVHRKDWANALEIVRRHEDRMHPGLAAYIRGQCWAELNQPRIAILFLDEAIRLGRRSAEQDVLWMTCQLEAGETAAAVPLARDFVKQSQHPLVVLRSAAVLLDNALQYDGSALRERFEETLTALQKGIELARRAPTEPIEPSTLDAERANAHVQLAIAYDALDNIKAAQNECQNALRIDPIHQHALALLGWLNQRAGASDQIAESLDILRRKQYRLTMMASERGLATMSSLASFG